jgi:hypothetical protein
MRHGAPCNCAASPVRLQKRSSKGQLAPAHPNGPDRTLSLVMEAIRVKGRIISVVATDGRQHSQKRSKVPFDFGRDFVRHSVPTGLSRDECFWYKSFDRFVTKQECIFGIDQPLKPHFGTMPRPFIDVGRILLQARISDYFADPKYTPWTRALLEQVNAVADPGGLIRSNPP